MDQLVDDRFPEGHVSKGTVVAAHGLHVEAERALRVPEEALDKNQPRPEQVLLDDDAVGPAEVRRPFVVGEPDELAVDHRAGQDLTDVAGPAEDEYRRPRRGQPVTTLHDQPPLVQELHIAQVMLMAGVVVGKDRPVPPHGRRIEEPGRLQLLQDPALVRVRGPVAHDAILIEVGVRPLGPLRPVPGLVAIHLLRLRQRQPVFTSAGTVIK